MPKYRLKSKFHSRDQLEPTYSETVMAHKGIVECELEVTKEILEKRGYVLIEEEKKEETTEEISASEKKKKRKKSKKRKKKKS